MPEKKITEAIKAGKVLVSDGAWGTFLHDKGLRTSECPELWNVTRFEDVKDIAKSYIEAGADMIETNSFGGTCYKLKHFGLSDKVAEINEAAAKVSREAAGEDKLVIASIGPTGKMLIMEDVTEDELYEAFKEQAVALEKGGADAVCIETMSDIDEAFLAVKAVRENTKMEIICTFTFEKTVRGDYRTMMGVTPSDAAKASVKAGADIIGTNCGNGIERMIEIVREMRSAAPGIPILVHANAGLPQNVDGKVVFPESPEDMAKFVPELIAAGADIIGGCCGTTPNHIRAIKEAVIGSLPFEAISDGRADRTDDLTVSEMLKMQYELWERNKSSWSPLEPPYARNSLLWMMAELGEVIDIIKKCGENTIITDEKVKAAFVEELCDVLMYFNDALLRYGISAKDIANAYVCKHNKNMARSFESEEKVFIKGLQGE